MGLIIAVDGPAASGKGTLARRLARELELRYLDTGALYRAVARDVMTKGGVLSDEQAALAAARKLRLDSLADPRLREQAVGAAASVVAKMPAVRDALLQLQRQCAQDRRGAVLDGRDIGTVVCPDAHVKLFVTAAPETRAQRRFAELRARGVAADFQDILTEIEARDRRDQNRTSAPLKPAEDAYLLNTTNLDIEEAYQAAMTYVMSVTDPSGCTS